MFVQFFSVGMVALLGAMQPGPDFALVTKNTILHSRRSGLFTSLGVGCAILVHMSYCVMGLAWVISEALFLFNLIKYVGGLYLIYLGLHSFFTRLPRRLPSASPKEKHSGLSSAISFRQGFLCNLLNPNTTLFFLALFTALIKPETPLRWLLLYVVEILVISLSWMCALTIILSHPRIKHLLEKAEKYIVKLLGLFLIAFGVALFFVSK